MLRGKPSGLVSRPARSTSSPGDRLQTKTGAPNETAGGGAQRAGMKEVVTGCCFVLFGETTHLPSNASPGSLFFFFILTLLALTPCPLKKKKKKQKEEKKLAKKLAWEKNKISRLAR